MAELKQLAELLRIGARTALTIAEYRPFDAATIQRLAAQAECIATDLDAMLEQAARRDPSQIQ